MRPLSNVQVLRGMAALAVVFFHVWSELSERRIPHSWPDMTVGAFGVDAFFVISGFIMIYSSLNNFGSASAALPFLLRRLARIVPLYWIITALYVLFIIGTKQNPGYTKQYIVASLMLMPFPEPGDGDYFPAYPLGWTLQFEMFFYLCLSGVMVFRRTVAVSLLGAALAALVATGRLLPLPWPLDVWASPQVLEFVFGTVLAEAFLRGFRLPTWVCLALAFTGIGAAIVTAPFIGTWFVWRGIVWGLPAAALMAAAVFHRPSTQGNNVRRTFERLGDASYSLYLVHFLLFVLIARIFEHFGLLPGYVSAPAYAALLTAAALAGAFASYLMFERPVTRWLQRRLAGAISTVAEVPVVRGPG